MRRNILFTGLAVAICATPASTAFAFVPAYTAPANKVGAAVAEGIYQNLIRRGFTSWPTDPRIISTVEAVGARVLPLATAAGSGANWIAMVSRLSPWVMGGVLVFQGLKWYFNQDGTVTTTNAGISPAPGTVLQGGACFYVIGGSYCGATPEEAITSYVLATTVYTDLTTISLTPDVVGSSAYTSGRRYAASIAGHRNNDLTTIWPSVSTYYIYQGAAQITCPIGYVANGTQCAPNQLAKYVPQPTTQTGQTPQTAYNNLPQTAKDANLQPELAAEIANRLWRDAATQPDYKGVPWSANDPVQAPDFTPHATNHPVDWPKTSDINAPVPTTKTPVALPETNPNQTTSPSTSTKVDLGADPGTPAPTLEEPPTDLFKPIKDLLQPWLSWQVPAHAAQCPTWQASPSIAGHVFAIDVSYHCTFAEQYRSMIVAASLACWIVIAAFIILSA